MSGGGPDRPEDGAGAGRGWVLLWLGVLFVLAMKHRLSWFGPSPFPLNDGALFLAFARAIGEAGFALPVCVEFNRACIPFAYPPLSFYAVAGLAELGLPLLWLVKWFPVAITALYSALGLVLLRRLIRSDLVLLAAAALFLFYYRSFEFLIMGGGVSRASGALFWMLALLAAERACRRPGAWPVVLCGLAIAGAILSHLEWGIAAAATVVLLFACHGPSWRAAVAGVAGAAVVSALAIAPWVATVLATHGLEPFRNASATSEWDPLLPAVRVLTLDIFPLSMMAFCAVGVMVTLRDRAPFWVLAMLLAQLLVPRSYLTVAALPASALAAIGIGALVALAARHLPRPAGAARLGALLGGPALALALAFYQTWMTHATSPAPANLEQLSDDAVAAMEWASAELDPETRFVILSGERWFADEVAEWFPLLTPFESLNTVQGTEWLPDREYWRRIGAYAAMGGRIGCAGIRETLATEFPDHAAVLETVDTGCFDDPAHYRELHSNTTTRIHGRP